MSAADEELRGLVVGEGSVTSACSGRKGGMLAAALLEVRVFPWRLRTRVMKASTFRDKISSVDPTLGTDDLSGFVVGLAVWLTIMLPAPLLVLILAGALFSVELPVLVIVALALVLARFTRLIPWTVVMSIGSAARGSASRRAASCAPCGGCATSTEIVASSSGGPGRRSQVNTGQGLQDRGVGQRSEGHL
jgi:hypothetical protein